MAVARLAHSAAQREPSTHGMVACALREMAERGALNQRSQRIAVRVATGLVWLRIVSSVDLWSVVRFSAW